ncbi:MAG: hypothetical protein LBL90_02645 [Prevotellaceae bacterium]|jgi:hypothetical protein|nr:hypothetical protein [Prevotellaceae bacterium]
MARPTTKEQLKQSGEEGFKKLFTLIYSMTEEEQGNRFPLKTGIKMSGMFWCICMNGIYYC